jgi:hypothetical protein
MRAADHGCDSHDVFVTVTLTAVDRHVPAATVRLPRLLGLHAVAGVDARTCSRRININTERGRAAKRSTGRGVEFDAAARGGYEHECGDRGGPRTVAPCGGGGAEGQDAGGFYAHAG